MFEDTKPVSCLTTVFQSSGGIVSFGDGIEVKDSSDSEDNIRFLQSIQNAQSRILAVGPDGHEAAVHEQLDMFCFKAERSYETINLQGTCVNLMRSFRSAFGRELKNIACRRGKADMRMIEDDVCKFLGVANQVYESGQNVTLVIKREFGSEVHPGDWHTHDPFAHERWQGKLNVPEHIVMIRNLSDKGTEFALNAVSAARVEEHGRTGMGTCAFKGSVLHRAPASRNFRWNYVIFQGS